MYAPMAEPLISVIVPVYKTEAYLPKCLDSICGQTYRNLEIICVDDESPDRSGEILEEYARRDPRVKVILRKNGGLSAARNSGLSAATGEWVTGVDSDDFLEPDIYEKAVEKLSEQVDILVFGMQLVYEEGVSSTGLESYFKLPEEGVLEQGDLRMTYTNVCFCNKLWRRSLIEGHGVTFPEGLIHEDEFFYRCLAPHARGIYILPRTGYNYVQRAGSIVHSGKSPMEKYRDVLPIIEQVLRYYISSGLKERGKEYILPFWQWRLLSVCGQECPSRYSGMARRMNAHIISQYNLKLVFHGDLRLFQLQPNPWWQRLFMKVYNNRISYRFFGIPLFSVVYENNRPVRKDSVWVNLFMHCLGR